MSLNLTMTNILGPVLLLTLNCMLSSYAFATEAQTAMAKLITLIGHEPRALGKSHWIAMDGLTRAQQDEVGLALEGLFSHGTLEKAGLGDPDRRKVITCHPEFFLRVIGPDNHTLRDIPLIRRKQDSDFEFSLYLVEATPGSKAVTKGLFTPLGMWNTATSVGSPAAVRPDPATGADTGLSLHAMGGFASKEHLTPSDQASLVDALRPWAMYWFRQNMESCPFEFERFDDKLSLDYTALSDVQRTWAADACKQHRFSYSRDFLEKVALEQQGKLQPGGWGKVSDMRVIVPEDKDQRLLSGSGVKYTLSWSIICGISSLVAVEGPAARKLTAAGQPAVRAAGSFASSEPGGPAVWRTPEVHYFVVDL